MKPEWRRSTCSGTPSRWRCLHRLLHSGARVVEEPIYFRDRERGVTKLGLDSMVEFMYQVCWLRLSSHRTFIKFCVTGTSGVFVNLGSFHLLTQFGVHRYLASPIAIELSIISNFVINNYWTFADRSLVGRKAYPGIEVQRRFVAVAGGQLRHVPCTVAAVASGSAGLAAEPGNRSRHTGELLSQFLLDVSRCGAAIGVCWIAPRFPW